MTVTVAQHDAAGPDAEQFAERLSAHLAEGIDGLEDSVGATSLIGSHFDTGLLVLRARCVVDPRAAALETWGAAVNAMQLGSALFAVTGPARGLSNAASIGRCGRFRPSARCQLPMRGIG